MLPICSKTADQLSKCGNFVTLFANENVYNHVQMSYTNKCNRHFCIDTVVTKFLALGQQLCDDLNEKNANITEFSILSKNNQIK